MWLWTGKWSVAKASHAHMCTHLYVRIIWMRNWNETATPKYTEITNSSNERTDREKKLLSRGVMCVCVALAADFIYVHVSTPFAGGSTIGCTARTCALVCLALVTCWTHGLAYRYFFYSSLCVCVLLFFNSFSVIFVHSVYSFLLVSFLFFVRWRQHAAIAYTHDCWSEFMFVFDEITYKM